MQNVDKLVLNPPIQYPYIWLYIGLGILGAIGIGYLILFFATRRKKIRSISSLKQLPPTLDMNGLKQKYIAIIDEQYLQYQNGQLTLRRLHTNLSMAVRSFVFEAKLFPAPRLTLQDLKRAPYQSLTNVVSNYYEKEFSDVEHGDPAASVQIAKDMVVQWV